jgi:DNA-binding transcriptional MerR regulator
MLTDLRRPHRTFTIRQLCLEFKCTPRALRFYEDKGLLAPARDGLNRVYSYKDRARLVMILQGKRVGLALAEIGEILDLYEVDDGGAQQAAKSLRKFRERIVALENQKVDIAEQIELLKNGCVEMEKRLTQTRPDLLPRAADYDQMLRRRLDGVEHSEAQ